MVLAVCTIFARTWKSDTIGSEKLYWQHYANINKTTLAYSRYFYIQWCTAWLKWDTILRSFGKYQGQLFNAITRVISFNSRPRILWSFFQTQILIWLNYRKIKGKCYINKDKLSSQEKRLWESRSSRKWSHHYSGFPLYWNVTFVEIVKYMMRTTW